MRIDDYQRHGGVDPVLHEVPRKKGADGEPDQQHAVVLKFGSSILRTPQDLPRVVAEIYRHARKGVGVIAVISAFGGETDRLIAEAESYGADRDCVHAPRLVSLGEERAAALLAIACDQSGLSSKVLSAAQFGFRASGPPRRADPLGVDQKALLGALAEHDVVITPGFVAIGDEGEPVLLGRGGSDLTAIIIASELGLGEASLLKDVDGVYDQDPAKAAGAAKRFAAISYEAALKVAGELVQSRAINHAKRRGVAIKVGRLGGRDQTIIATQTAPPAVKTPAAPLRVALAGCGVVGTGVAELLAGRGEDFELCAVLVRDLEKPRAAAAGDARFVDSVEALFDQRPDVIVDVLSCGDTGRALTGQALGRGVSVVSANKQALCDDLDAFHRTARAEKSALAYGAAVGGGAPMVETVRRVAKNGAVRKIEAVVNGTVNYILSELAAGRDFEAAVKAAQAAGFAEADPSADLSGADAAAKAKILAWEAFGAPLAGPVPCEVLDKTVIDAIAARPGRWRQITKITLDDDGAPVASVAYAPVAEDDLFWDLPGECNGVRITTQAGHIITARGRGAGAAPTAHSILGDLGALRRHG